MESSSGSNWASDFKSAERDLKLQAGLPLIVGNEVLLPINCVDNKMRETVFSQRLKKGSHNLRKTYLNKSHKDQLILSMFVFKLHPSTRPLKNFFLILIG